MSGVIEVAVVGAGPAGLAAALAAGDRGCEVTLIDTGSGLGGQFYRPGMLFPGRDQASRAAAAGQLPARLARIRRVRQVRHLAVTWVGQAERDHAGIVTLWVAGPEGGAETTVQVRTVVLATGAVDLVLPFPGWDLPGVTTAGAPWALLKGQGVTMGRRVLVGGSGPLLLPLAVSLVQAGVRVVAVLEATPALAVFPAATLARHQVPVRTGYAVIACHGTDRVEQAVVARLDRDWRPVPGSERVEAVDAVHVSFGSSPALEGYLTGTSAAHYLGRLQPEAYAEQTRTARARLDPSTVMCRCEETRWSEISAAMAAGARDLPAVQAATRCGTGYCQARICGPALRAVTDAAAAS